MMAETVHIPPHVIGEIESAYGLAQLQLDPNPHVGTGYLTFRVTTPRGDLALRRRRGSGVKISAKHPDIGNRIERQHALVSFLHDQGLPVAEPISTKGGRTYVSILGVPYSLYPYVDGRPMDPADPSQLTVAARTLAKYHQATARYYGAPPLSKSLLPKAFEDGLDPFHMYAGILTGPLSNLGLGESIQFFSDSLAGIKGELAALNYETLPKTLIHGDFTRLNLLFRENELLAVLDFGRSRREARLLDLSITSYSLMRTVDKERWRKLADAFLDEYCNVLPLEDRERSALPILTQGLVALKVFRRVRKLTEKRRAAGDTARKVRKLNLLVEHLRWVKQ